MGWQSPTSTHRCRNRVPRHRGENTRPFCGSKGLASTLLTLSVSRAAGTEWHVIDRGVPGAENLGGGRNLQGMGGCPIIDRVPGRALCPGCSWRCR